MIFQQGAAANWAYWIKGVPNGLDCDHYLYSQGIVPLACTTKLVYYCQYREFLIFGYQSAKRRKLKYVLYVIEIVFSCYH